MTSRDPFALPPVNPKTTAQIKSVSAFIKQGIEARNDWRTILKGLVREHEAKVTYPSYRTALRVAGIYTECAGADDLREAQMMLERVLERSVEYLATVRDGDLFAPRC